ncbi:hypothetical protein Tco_0427802 [Tanacetum coccineum]
MLASMTPKLQKNLKDFNANDMLKGLKTMFSHQSEQELLETVKVFHACMDQLERLGHFISLHLGVSLILTSLSNEYEGVVQNYNMHSICYAQANEKRLPKKVVVAHVVLEIR